MARLPYPCVLLLLALTGCSSAPQSAYEQEDFTQRNTYSRSFQASSQTACDAGRRALLSQGYLIDKAEPVRIAGHKSFQGDNSQHIQISFNIDCAPDSNTQARATVFVNAIQDRYSIKKTSSSASVGLSVLGSVSMPFTSSDDSLVKTASETIARPAFYNGFFGLLEQFLPTAQASAPIEAHGPASIAPSADILTPQPLGDAMPSSQAPAINPDVARPVDTAAPAAS